jgi:hypothetical protein
MPREAEKIVQEWLDEISFSAATWNLDAHMKLVSPQVRVTGIPGISSIDYNGWKLRRKNEFEKKLLRSLTYQLHDIVAEEEDEIRFSVKETMKSSSGRSIVIDKEVTLHRESDGQWRVRQEHFDRIRQR